MKRVITAALLALLVILVVAAAGWGILSLAFSGPLDDAARKGSIAAFSVVSIATLVAIYIPKWRRPALGAFAVAFAVLLARHLTIAPSNARDWTPEVAVLSYATIEGDLVTVHNIRNFDYRSETDFTPSYYDKTFDIRTLDGVDLVAVYWMGPAIAHTFLSFSFSGGHHLAVSIETRKEEGEGYSTIKGFFRQYELFYAVADERDVIRLRTNYRQAPPEDVYVYRMQRPVDNGGRVFLEYMRRINSLRSSPAFYNTLTSNCTVDIWYNTLVNADHLPFSWKIVASGYLPEYLHEAGLLDSSVDFAVLRRQAHVNERAQAADAAADFSRLIRQPPQGSAAEGGRSGTPPRSRLQDSQDGRQESAPGDYSGSPAR